MKKKHSALLRVIDRLLIDHFGIPKKNTTPPDPLDLLIATILSQNTNDKNSFRAYQNLISRYENWGSAAAANVRSIEKEIRVAGLGPQKSRAIKNLLLELRKKTGRIDLNYIRDFTDDEVIGELTSFKGIGVKTASCVLLFSFQRNVCPVDTHVHRTLNRIGIVKTKSPEKTYFELNENFPAGIAHSFHTNLIRLGREICKPANPSCGICPLMKICKYENKSDSNYGKSKINDFMLLDNIG